MELIVKIAALMSHPDVAKVFTEGDRCRDLRKMHESMNTIHNIGKKYLKMFPEINEQEWFNHE